MLLPKDLDLVEMLEISRRRCRCHRPRRLTQLHLRGVGFARSPSTSQQHWTSGEVHYRLNAKPNVPQNTRMVTGAIFTVIAGLLLASPSVADDPLHRLLQSHDDLQTERQLSFESLLSQNAPRDRPTLLGQQSMRLEPVVDPSEEAPGDTTGNEATERPAGNAAEDGTDTRDADTMESRQKNEAATRESQRRATTISHLMKLRKPVAEIRLGATSDADIVDRPPNRAGELLVLDAPQWITATGGRATPPSRYPVSFCHRPLYYQQPDLERCGRTFSCGEHRVGCMQNAVSGFTFLVNTMVLPYRLATERPECLIPHQGDCRTCQSTGGDIDPLQPGACGWVTQAAAIAGFTFLLL